MSGPSKSPPKRKYRPIRLNLEEELRFLNSLGEEDGNSNEENQNGASDGTENSLSGSASSRNDSILSSNKPSIEDKTSCRNVLSNKSTEKKTPSSNIGIFKGSENKMSEASSSLILYQTPKGKQQVAPFYTPTLQTIKENIVNKPKIQYSTHINSYKMHTPGGSDVLKRQELKHESMPRINKPTAMGPPNSVHKNKENELNVINKSIKTIVVKGIEYLVLKELGRGGSSVIYHCYDPKSQEEYAVKCVNLNHDPVITDGFINEVNTLKKLSNCDRIINIFTYELLKNEKKLYVILEKGDRDLSQILNETCKSMKHFPMYLIVYYWMEMLHAVKQIHSIGVIHSDLKPSNFVQVKGRIKLIDFGIASCIQKDMTSVVKNVAFGTFNYISPEALCNQKSTNLNSPNFGKTKFKLSYKSDVWSLGCILYQLVYRRTPFQHIGHTAAKLVTIMDPNHAIEYPKAYWVKPAIIEMIKSCLRFNMKERPSIDELISDFI